LTGTDVSGRIGERRFNLQPLLLTLLILAFMADHVGDAAPAVQDPDVLWTVELDSPGGDLAEAMRIGRFLRDALATTEVTYRYARRPDGVLDFARGGDLVCLEGEGRLTG